MRLRARLVAVLGIAAALGFAAHQGMAYPEAARTTKAACSGCHANVAGGADLTDAGKAWQGDNTKVPTGGTANEYLGANKCKTCHSKQYKAWVDTKHAGGLATLTKADPKVAAEWAEKMKVTINGTADKTEGCIGCHVTGHQLAGGFPQADSTAMANLSFVGCESCHGPGAAHKAAAKEEKKTFINNAVGEKLCKQCHTAAASPNFNYEEMKTKIHPVPAE